MPSHKPPDPIGPDPDERRLSDDELFKLYIEQRSLGALAEIYRRFRSRIYNFCLTNLGSPKDAEDAMQETFLAVLKRVETLKPGNVHGYLFECARRGISEVLRKRRATVDPNDCVDQLEAALTSRDSPSQNVERRELLERIWAAVDRLSDTDRQVLTMHYQNAMDVNEMAGKLQITNGAVHQRLSRARRSLCDLLVEDGVLPRP